MSSRRIRIGNRDLLEELRAQGWAISITKKNHLRLESPQGGVVFASGTPSDHRAIHRLRTDLKRYGFREAS